MSDKPVSKVHYSLYCGKRLAQQLGVIWRTGSSVDRQYCVLPDKQLIYLTNAKVACSSLKASVLKMPEQPDYHAVHKTALAHPNVQFNIPYDAYPGYFRFTFVRNPFQRLVSCYESRCHEHAGHYNSYLMGYLRKDRGFAGFVSRVVRIPPIFAEKHICPQSYLLHDRKGHSLVGFVGHFEHLQEEYEPIREKYDLDPLPHYNKTKKVNWMDYYDRETARLTRDYYARDLAEFGYADQYDKLIAYIAEKEGKPT